MSSQIARKVVSFSRTREKPLPKQARRLDLLTNRENEILEQLSRGLTYKEIAGQLFLSRRPCAKTSIIYTKNTCQQPGGNRQQVFVI